MDIKQKLKYLADNIDGFSSAVFSGTDGVEIASFSYNELKAVGLEVEVAGLLHNVASICKTFRFGDSEEIIISSAGKLLLVKMIGKRYFLALLLEAAGNLGKARLEVKKITPDLEKDLFQ